MNKILFPTFFSRYWGYHLSWFCCRQDSAWRCGNSTCFCGVTSYFVRGDFCLCCDNDNGWGDVGERLHASTFYRLFSNHWNLQAARHNFCDSWLIRSQQRKSVWTFNRRELQWAELTNMAIFHEAWDCRGSLYVGENRTKIKQSWETLEKKIMRSRSKALNSIHTREPHRDILGMAFGFLSGI